MIQFVVDTSQSMNQAPGSDDGPNVVISNTPSKWDTTKAALVSALHAMPPQTPVGVFFFPGGETRRECLQRNSGEPIAPLDAAASSIAAVSTRNRS